MKRRIISYFVILFFSITLIGCGKSTISVNLDTMAISELKEADMVKDIATEVKKTEYTAVQIPSFDSEVETIDEVLERLDVVCNSEKEIHAYEEEQRRLKEKEKNENRSTASNPSSDITATATSYEEFVSTMLADVNALRREQGVGDLVLDQQCNAVGNIRAAEIATFFSHTRPNGKGFYTAWDDCGYKYSNVGENLSKYMIGGETLSLSQAAHDSFDILANSPTHYENMIKSKWTRVYFNVYIIEDGSRTYYYCVQTFSK